MAHPRVILAFVLTLLAAAWTSPCCCQTEWLAARATQALHLADQAAPSCPCCAQKGGMPHQDGCPVDSSGCKKTATVSTQPPAAGVAVAPAPVFVIDVPIVSSTGPWGALWRPDAQAPRAGPPSSLLGLHCALTV